MLDILESTIQGTAVAPSGKLLESVALLSYELQREADHVKHMNFPGVLMIKHGVRDSLFIQVAVLNGVVCYTNDIRSLT